MSFFILEIKKVVTSRGRQVIVLYSNDCMGICVADSALVVLDEWFSYRGSRLNRCSNVEFGSISVSLQTSDKIFAVSFLDSFVLPT